MKTIQYCLFYCFSLLLCAHPQLVFGQGSESVFLGSWTSDDNIPPSIFGAYNDVWGIVVDGKEYGVIGSTMGVHFISLDEADSPREVAFVAGADQGSIIVHRDFHSYQNYLYTVADEGASTLQIIDFSGLPESVEVVYDSDEFLTNIHNIFIDEDNARLYTSNSVQVYDLTNPEQPVPLDLLAIHGLNTPNYAHDIFAKDNILYINGGNTGLAVVDYNDATNPILLGTMYNYPNQGYNHAGWLSEDGNHYYLCDETGGADVKTVRVDDFTDMEVIDRFKADNDNPLHIAHNAMVRGDLLYVSYYSDGLQVFDISDPANVTRVWNYDTYPGKNNEGFLGAWGIYALLPSGRILVSDFDGGLFYFAPPEGQAFFQFEDTVSACVDEGLEFDLFIGPDFEADGVTLSAEGLPAGFDVVFSQNPAPANSTVSVSVENWPTDGVFDFTINGTDNVHEVTTMVTIDLGFPASIDLELPVDGETVLPNAFTFEWEAQAGIESYQLQIGPTPTFGFGTTTIDVNSNTYTISSSNALASNFTYYWRVQTVNSACGELVTDPWSFTTENAVSTEETASKNWRVYPNPAKEFIVLECSNDCLGTLDLQLLDISGKVVEAYSAWANEGNIVWNLNAKLHGLYILRIINGDETQIKRLVFE